MRAVIKIAMAVRSELRFPIQDRPKWRGSYSSITTAKIIDDIVKFRKNWKDSQEEEKKFCKESFAPIMTVEFIYNLNVGEQVGSQTRAETEVILNNFLDKSISQGSEITLPNQDTKRKETLNALKAMQKLHDIFTGEMESQGLLTVQQVCEVHGILMDGLHPDAGKIRPNKAFTTRHDGGVHWYPLPEKIEDPLYALIDCHNIYVSKLPPENSKEEVEYIIRCAARLMFDFVDTHPFGDGNGRMCCLGWSVRRIGVGVCNHGMHSNTRLVGERVASCLNTILARIVAQNPPLLHTV